MAIATGQVRTDDDIRDFVLEELKWDPKITSPAIAVAVKDEVAKVENYITISP